MPSRTKTEPTALEKLDCAVGIVGVLLRTLIFSLKYPFLSSTNLQPTFSREVSRLLARWVLDRLNVAQLQWVAPPTTAVYMNWMANHAATEGVPAEPFTELIGDEGAKLHWVGRKEATKVILHMHGGGYVMSIISGHFSFINYIRKEVRRQSGVEVKTAFLEYSLVPVRSYPTQFRQAVLALQHVLDSGISPADIIISGDSVGGQLALQIISHILHPHSGVPRFPLSVPTVPFAGILMLSPWVIFNSTASSFVNNTTDFISATRLLEWGGKVSDDTAIANGKAEPGGFWGEALKAPPEWWHDTEKVTGNMMVVYGSFEAFFDDNVALVKKMREGVAGRGVEITAVEEPKGIHIGPIIDALMGRAPSELSKIIAGWVNERLSN